VKLLSVHPFIAFKFINLNTTGAKILKDSGFIAAFVVHVVVNTRDKKAVI